MNTIKLKSLGIITLILLLGVGVLWLPSLLLAEAVSPQQHNYQHYRLKLSASERRPESGQSVVFNTQVVPAISGQAVRYTYTINGKTYESRSDTKIHIFNTTGTYKVVANALFANGVILSSQPVVVHVVAAWQKPEARITPHQESVVIGFPAIFYSESHADPSSRRWLYWEMSNGHKGRGDEFHIDTSRLKPGTYTIELLLRDDRQRESRTQSTLVVKEHENDVVDTEVIESGAGMLIQEPKDLVLRASQSHRLEGKSLVFWIENAQPGADTLLRLDTGDYFITPWGRRFRYNHIYHNFGVYAVQAMAKTEKGIRKSNVVIVYIWPLWFPVFLVLAGLMVAAIPFLRRQKKKLSKVSSQPVMLSTQIEYGGGVHDVVLTRRSSLEPDDDMIKLTVGVMSSVGDVKNVSIRNVAEQHDKQIDDVNKESKQGG